MKAVGSRVRKPRSRSYSGTLKPSTVKHEHLTPDKDKHLSWIWESRCSCSSIAGVGVATRDPDRVRWDESSARPRLDRYRRQNCDPDDDIGRGHGTATFASTSLSAQCAVNVTHWDPEPPSKCPEDKSRRASAAACSRSSATANSPPVSNAGASTPSAPYGLLPHRRHRQAGRLRHLPTRA